MSEGGELSVIPFGDEDEAIRIAEDSPYGLEGGVWTADPEHGAAVARRIRSGYLTVNGASVSPSALFGLVLREIAWRPLASIGTSTESTSQVSTPRAPFASTVSAETMSGRPRRDAREGDRSTPGAWSDPPGPRQDPPVLPPSGGVDTPIRWST
nr:aldehyde dehydrogenase family protein [Nocardiopsis sp. SBT366]